MGGDLVNNSSCGFSCEIIFDKLNMRFLRFPMSLFVKTKILRSDLGFLRS